MCSRWEEIGRALEKCLERGGRGFEELAAGRAPRLRGFNDPRAVLDYLHGRSGSDPERDVLLGELVTAAKTRDRAGQLAQTLLWLAFWPGLTALLRRVLVSSIDEGNEVAAELAEKFAVVVGTCDPSAVTKVAATSVP